MAIRTKDTIINAALLKNGHSANDSNGIYIALLANYDDIVRSAFEEAGGALEFGRGRVTLTSRAAGGFGYDDSYTLPSDVLHIIEVYFNEVSASDLMENWEVDATVPSVLLNASGRTIEIEYIKEGQEHTWSATFALGVQLELEAVIKNVTEELDEAMAKKQEASSKFLAAGIKGSKNRSKRPIWKRGGGRILRARGRSYSDGGR